jgi:hypothetical protein
MMRAAHYDARRALYCARSARDARRADETAHYPRTIVRAFND